MVPRPMKQIELIRLCPHCGNTTPHEILFECSAPMTWYGSDGQPTTNKTNPDSDYVLIRCQTCRDIALYAKLSINDWHEETSLMYPTDYNLHSCIPAEVASNYQEAKRVQNVSPNAFAVLLRRSLEAICNDRGVSEGSLSFRLKELATKGEIPGNLAEISSVLRELGNAGAHHTTQRVTVPMTWTMDEFFRAIVEYVYVAPHQLEQFQRNLAKYDKSAS
jgi:hypothetical protein